MNYWRNVEVPAVIDELEVKPSDTILDVGSPKIASLFLWSCRQCNVYATDLFDYFFQEYQTYVDGIADEPVPGAFRMETQDARCLTYPDAFFDKVFSISVLEHISGDGDTLAIQQMSRVLKPGGVCCITVPFSASYGETYTTQQSYYIKMNDNQPVFYERHYDEATLRSRLIAPSGLHVAKLQLFVERAVPYGRLCDRLPLPIRIGLAPLSRFATDLFIAGTDHPRSGHAMTAMVTLVKREA